MYSVSQLVNGVRYPRRGFHELNRLYHSRLHQRSHNPGVDVLNADWDNLLILDACRYDMFAQTNSMAGELMSKTSRGSSTVEFLFANFENEDLLDTVYVTANPQFYRHEESIGATFHHVENVWNGEEWDKDEGTVLPEVVTERGKTVLEEFDKKRLIVHYIQPHYPFIGAEWEEDKGNLEQTGKADPWRRIFLGELEITRNKIWQYYVENLKIALPHVKQLVESLTGKTVVTSDHGNMVGERSFPIPIKDWGHPSQLYTEPLVTVPWLECPFENRREITPEPARGQAERTDSDYVTDRLKHLGYV